MHRDRLGCGKKNLNALIEQEKEAETDRILARLDRDSSIDLEATEFYVRKAMLAAGGEVVQRVLKGFGRDRPRTPVLCRCGQTMRSEGLRPKRLLTILGRVEFRRPRYKCEHCGRYEIPADAALDIEGTQFSPGARHLMTHVGCTHPFGEGKKDLKLLAELDAPAKNVERVAERVGEEMDLWMKQQSTAAQLRETSDNASAANDPIEILYVSFDGTGIPMRLSELAHTKSKTPGERAKTREVKLGCVFTQTTTDDQGRAVRDPDTSTYVGAIENRVDFGYRIYGEAVRRGLRRAKRVVIVCDGAPYNKAIIAEHFPDAIVIIDLYHARERVYKLARLLLPESEREAIEKTWLNLLDRGDVEGLIEAVHTRIPRNGKRKNEALKNLNYFKNNAPYMRYKHFQSQGLFVGSGVVEAGCKTLIGRRLKLSGMFWSERGANAIIAARCCHYSNRTAQFWEDRAA